MQVLGRKVAKGFTLYCIINPTKYKSIPLAFTKKR
nr:MAG TPA: hypothetical protein [Caudoviricetes sp.]